MHPSVTDFLKRTEGRITTHQKGIIEHLSKIESFQCRSIEGESGKTIRDKVLTRAFFDYEIYGVHLTLTIGF